MKNLKYTVVIVTYNRLNLLKECLEHCLSQTVPFSKILVIDNHSTDGTGRFLDLMCETRDSLMVHHMSKNSGGAGGFYQGLRMASDMDTDYILLIDDDAIIDYDYIEKIEPYIVNNIMAYSGTVKTPLSPLPDQRHMICDRTFLFTRAVSPRMYDGEYFDYDISSFCGLMISVRLVSEAGLPKKDYYIWHDDIEYSLRIGRMTRIRNINAAGLIHKTSSPASGHRFNWKSYYGGRNSWDTALTYSKHPGLYSVCRILYHSAGSIFWLISAVIPKDREYRLRVSKMHRDILRFAFDRRLGCHPDYTPENGFS